MRPALLLAALTVAAAALAAAPTPGAADPLKISTAEGQQRFRYCRAAALMHLRAADWRKAVVSKEATVALMEQITLIMTEAVNSMPSRNFEDAHRRAMFAERFYFDLKQTVDANADRFADTAFRDRVLIECSPFIWRLLRPYVDNLMELRFRSVEKTGPGWRIEALEAAGARRGQPQ